MKLLKMTIRKFRKIPILKDISSALVLFSILFSVTNCVETQNPTFSDGGGDTTTDTKGIKLTVTSPVKGDTIRMGKNSIIYSAADIKDGDGLYAFSLVVTIPGQSPTEIQTFPVITDGVNPDIYIHTDSIEAKFKFDPVSFPSRINYWLTAYSKTSNVDPKTIIHDSVFVDRRPEVPQNLSLIRNTNKSFNLYWKDVSSNEANFEIWRKDGNNAGYLKIFEVPANNISKNDGVPSEFITYYYKIRAVNQFGASAFSNIVNSSGAAGGGQPTSLVAEALGAKKIKLTWTDNADDEYGFTIQRTNPLNGNFEDLVNLPPNTIEYFDNDVLQATSYSYRICSYTNTALSAWSNIASATTSTIDVPAPYNLIASYSRSKEAVELSWTDMTLQENGTIIERKVGANGIFEFLYKVATDITTYTDASVSENVEYTYRARHTTVSGFNTDYSNEAKILVPLLAPQAPSNLRISEFQANTLYGLVWVDNSNNEDGFELLRIEEGTLDSIKIQLPKNTKAYNDKVPDPSRTYTYMVRAYRGTLYSEYSNSVNTKGAGNTLPVPSDFKAAQVTGKVEVLLTWTYANPNNILGFIIEKRAYDELEFSEIDRVGPSAVSYTDKSGLTPDGTYLYRMKAYSSTEESDYTSVYPVTLVP